MPLLGFLLLGSLQLGACSSVQIPDDPIAALAIAEGHLGRHEADVALEILEELDPESFTGEDVERYEVLLARAYLDSGDPWEGFKVLRDFDEDHPFSRLRGEIQDLEYEIGRALITSDWTFWIFASDADDGQIVLEHFVLRYPRHPATPDALRLLGEKAFAEGNWDLARERFSDIALKHKDSEWVPLAQFRVAMASFYSLVGPAYDLPSLLRAQAELSEFLAAGIENPTFVGEARKALATVREWLGRKQVLIADFYRTIGNEAGERLHLQAAARDYADTGGGREATERLARLQPVKSGGGGGS